MLAENRTGEESGCGLGRRTRPNSDSRQTKYSTVDEPTASILVDEKFGGQFLHTVGAFGCGDSLWRDHVRLWHMNGQWRSEFVEMGGKGEEDAREGRRIRLERT